MEPQAYTELHQLEPTHWWYRGMRAITEAVLERTLIPQRDLTILDAGCGAGGNLSHLARFGQTYGCDYSPLALDYARERHAGRLAQATVESLPYRDGAFDLVTCFDVLYALEVEDDVRALTEVARVLAPQGYFLLRLPAFNALSGQHDFVVHGQRRYTRREVAAKLRRAGLTPLRITYANSLLFPFIYAIRRWQRMRGAFVKSAPSDVRPTAALVNALLYRLLLVEAAWIKRGFGFLLGVSVIVLARKES